eukprot:TRINITY_DN2475_c0_g1_i1.p1 TRINITY_DN2475_c0_g1~~TRINITY_DN2475_c0_g1_i1.p1  ORF type:complete len:833 (+),score=181.17 TRINITY_DN2475_c0_g1_i1:140-2638(+)
MAEPTMPRTKPLPPRVVRGGATMPRQTGNEKSASKPSALAAVAPPSGNSSSIAEQPPLSSATGASTRSQPASPKRTRPNAPLVRPAYAPPTPPAGSGFATTPVPRKNKPVIGLRADPTLPLAPPIALPQQRNLPITQARPKMLLPPAKLLRRSQMLEDQLQSAKQEVRMGVIGMMENSEDYTVFAKMKASKYSDQVMKATSPSEIPPRSSIEDLEKDRVQRVSFALDVVKQFVDDAVPESTSEESGFLVEDNSTLSSEVESATSSIQSKEGPSSPTVSPGISPGPSPVLSPTGSGNQTQLSAISPVSTSSIGPEIPPFDVKPSSMEFYDKFIQTTPLLQETLVKPNPSAKGQFSKTLPKPSIGQGKDVAEDDSPENSQTSRLTKESRGTKDTNVSRLPPNRPPKQKSKPNKRQMAQATSYDPSHTPGSKRNGRMQFADNLESTMPTTLPSEMKTDEDDSDSINSPSPEPKPAITGNGFDELKYLTGKDDKSSYSKDSEVMEELVRKAVEKCLDKIYELNPDALVIQHKGEAVRVRNLAPSRFRLIRNTFQVSREQLVNSICKSGKMSGGVSKGKSGQYFFATSDHRFVLKTLTREEYEFLEEKFVLEYASYMAKHKNSMLPRFYSCIKIASYRFIVMNHVFCTDLKMHEVYDLKGSTVGRVASKEEPSILKDNDLLRSKRHFYFSAELLLGLYLQLTEDVQFLSDHNVMDYSLLIGIHVVDDRSPLSDPDYKSQSEEELAAGYRSMFQKEFGGMFARDGEDEPLAEVYFLGIIDILQNFGARKKLENMFLSIAKDSTGISALPPDPYSNRFLGFVFKNVIKYDNNRKKVVGL